MTFIFKVNSTYVARSMEKRQQQQHARVLLLVKQNGGHVARGPDSLRYR